MVLQTVNGVIAGEEMGVTLTHEHIFVGSRDMWSAFGDNWVNRKELADYAVKELTLCRERWGLRTMLDGTATDTARDVGLIREVAEESGVQIAYSTGLYHAEAPFIAGKRPEEFAKYFIEECKSGSAGFDCKPAFLKCATGKLGMTDINRIEVAAMAVTQRETGLPLFCHNEHKVHTADAQIEVFREYGADLSRVIIGHASDCPDVDYLMGLYETGVWLSFDRIGPGRTEIPAKVVAELLKRGADRILLSHDHCVYLDFGNASWEKTRAKGWEDLNLDFCYLFRNYLPALKELGVTDEQIHMLTVENPAKAYCI